MRVLSYMQLLDPAEYTSMFSFHVTFIIPRECWFGPIFVFLV